VEKDEADEHEDGRQDGQRHDDVRQDVGHCPQAHGGDDQPDKGTLDGTTAAVAHRPSVCRPPVIDELATIQDMPRPVLKTPLIPRQPRTVLGWTMRELRHAADWNARQTAKAFGCSPSHITRVELGQNRPSRELVNFYEEQFAADGLLRSLFEVVEHHAEQERRRVGGHKPPLIQKLPGDASEFVGQSIPHGKLMKPGERFAITWHIRNNGAVPWVGRHLERQGPRAGPGLILSPRHVLIPPTRPGETATIMAKLRAPSYDCSSIAYFKMVNESGNLSFPDNYQLGLDVLVMVRGQMPDKPGLLEFDADEPPTS
jgi:transcriptional regulator with XRE-family HTH domain